MKQERLKAKIAKEVEDKGATIDEEASEDLKSIIAEKSAIVLENYPEGSFPRLFGRSSKKASSFANPKSMKWHPMMVKWCLYQLVCNVRFHTGRQKRPVEENLFRFSYLFHQNSSQINYFGGFTELQLLTSEKFYFIE